jgi:hypothetical protein
MPMPEAPAQPDNPQVQLSPDEQLKALWDKYGKFIYYVFGAVAIGLIARGGIDYVNREKEAGIEKEYLACTTPDSYLSFAVKHPGHPLAGVAEETVADNSYASGKYLDALKAYSSAVTDLPEGPVRDHAKLGQAMSLELTGRTGEAESALRALVEDPAQMKTIRCEAGYHLAGLEVAAGRAGDVAKLSDELMKIDPESPFAERTFMLRSTLPAEPAPGSVTVPGAPSR